MACSKCNFLFFNRIEVNNNLEKSQKYTRVANHTVKENVNNRERFL